MKRWLAALLVCTACDGLGGDGSSNAGEPCPDGDLLGASQASVQIIDFQVDGLPLFAAFDPTALYEEQGPSACVNEDGTQARVHFEVDSLPFGSITLGGETLGSQDLNGADATLSIDLYGATPPARFQLGQWTTGSFSLNSTNPMDADVTGSAVNGDRALTTTFSVIVHP
jgi:hypothetical protein